MARIGCQNCGGTMGKPAYTADRLTRCLAKYIRWRAFSIRHPRDRMARALCAYWEREARKVQA